MRRTYMRCAKKAVEKAAPTEAAAAMPMVPKMLSNADVGGPSTYDIQKNMTEREIKMWETDWIKKNIPQSSQKELNNYYTATQAPGFNGGSWRFDIDWQWKHDALYAPWHTQQYLIGGGRNPGGYPFWGVVEWIKINVYEGWRLRRNLWKLWTWTAVTMGAVWFRDLVWDPTKEKGIEGQIQRRREGKFINWWGLPWLFVSTIFMGPFHSEQLFFP